ncbi:alpha-2-macroglobulin-like [Channa argus]|uniref:alpha-2-macroglobulin-like n=1 Tax=Channa argus TaxID=215402 RepID=UPI0029485468|nr:hypothetical protein Q8A73_006976 [Channa argus]
MGHPGIQIWTLCVTFTWICVNQVTAGPQYIVTIPAVLEAGAETKFCTSLLQPNETLVMTVTLSSDKQDTTLLKRKSKRGFHICTQFKVPSVQKEVIENLEVVVAGNTFHSREVRKVMIKVYRPLTFVQTDKPIYLPGQTVHFRVVTLDTKFRPFNQLYNMIEFQDANKNRIGQWLNETSDGKILQLSFSLISEASEGTYQIIVSVGEDQIYQDFKVQKYVLPKFGMTLDAPDQVSIVQGEINVEVCANYTYGPPVPGLVTAGMCRLKLYINSPDPAVADVTTPCRNKTKQMDKRGCATFTFKMSRFTKIDPKVLGDVLDINAKLEEEGTGISQYQEKKISISYIAGKLSFINTPTIYKKGSDVKGQVKAVDYNNAPIPDMPVYLFDGEMWSSHLLLNLTTDSNGVAMFSLSTANYTGDIHLYVGSAKTLEYPAYRTAYYETGDIMLSMIQPVSPDAKTISSLHIKEKDKPLPCDTDEDFFIQYTIAGESEGSVDVMYLVLSRGTIVLQGYKKVGVKDTSVNKGEVSFTLKVSPEMAPDVQVVAYAVLPSDTVIANGADFSIEKCFSQKVLLEFSLSSAVPGEETTMQVRAPPDSLCGISAVDQSILIMEPGKSLDATKLFNLLPVTRVSYIPYEVQDSTECLNVRAKRSVVKYPGNNQQDVYTVFQNVGLKIATNLFVQMPPCLLFKGREYYGGPIRFANAPALAKEGALLALPAAPPGEVDSTNVPIITVRSFFPETWIWDLVDIGESGTKDVSLTVPDTITTWETEAFCLSPQGFGLAPRKEIKVFQPFFLELTLPYSIIRGEHFELKATVFNYLTSCIMVQVTPAPSSNYSLTPLAGNQYTSCLCSSERKTLSWTMVPSVLGTLNVSVTAEAVVSDVSCDNEIVSVPERGRIDVVTKSLIVEAEGTEMAKAYNWLLCPKGAPLTAQTKIKLPKNVIDGSAHASVSVLGDILGRALQNLDGLLQMPYGCGEQNMALLAPNIYILQYLQDTQQLTPAIREKATNFLTSGYQRQLNYKSGDGAYTTFGSGPGNTWLTAFVLRSLAKAQSFIYIDPTKIEESKTWLEHKQETNGCFQQSGNLFNNRMKGGVSDEVTLSAYITAAFLEMKMEADNPVVSKSLLCLKESINDLSNTYTTALLAYVFTLAGDMETRAHLLQHLDSVALDEGGFLHWSQTATETSASLSVEISSYVLLAKLSASPTAEDLGYSSRIVRWLTGQQNYYGGFSSTQDTVVALQALALYSTLVFSPEGSSTVTVQSPSGQLTFDVNQDNKLLYQEKMLYTVTGKYSVAVKGTACASIQLSLHYNIPTPTEVTTLSVEVKPEPDCTIGSLTPKLTLNLKSLYSGEENSTNMVILDIKMLSGFVPHPESLKSLQHALLVDHVEQKGDHVLVYIQELPKDMPVNHSLVLIQEVLVQNLKSAWVQIYDYYQPGDQAKMEYTYSCTTE